MTTTRSISAALLGLAALAGVGCGGAHNHQAPTPGRPTENLVDEVRARHADLVDAVRNGDPSKLSPNLMDDALLITPARDTIRGIPAIAAQLGAFRAAVSPQTIRGTPGSGVVRCFDGILERVGEWSIATLAPDSSFKFTRGPLGIQWVTRGDSLGARIIDMASSQLAPELSGCVSVERARFAARRLEAFYTFGFFTPTSFQRSAEQGLAQAGYTPSDGNDARFTKGNPPSAAQIIGVSARIRSNLWVTVAGPRAREDADVGRCNPNDLNYLHVQRQHRPVGLTLDLHLPRGFAMGVGPAFASNTYSYKEYDVVPWNDAQRISFQRCGAVGFSHIYDSTAVTKSSVGVAGNMRFQMRMSSHASLMARLQMFRFPVADAPMNSKGMSLAFKDLTTTLGWGLTFSY